MGEWWVFRFSSGPVSALWRLCFRVPCLDQPSGDTAQVHMAPAVAPPQHEAPLHFPLPSLQVTGAYHVGGQLVPWQVFDILMLCVDDLCQLSAPDVFLKHPHGHPWVKACQLGCIATHDLGDG